MSSREQELQALYAPIPFLQKVKTQTDEIDLQEFTFTPKADFIGVEAWSVEDKIEFTRRYLHKFRATASELLTFPKHTTFKEMKEVNPSYVGLALFIQAYKESLQSMQIAQNEREEAENTYQIRKKTTEGYKKRQRLIDNWTQFQKPTLDYHVENIQAEQNLLLDMFLRDFFLQQEGVQHFLDAATEFVADPEEHPQNTDLLRQFSTDCIKRVQSYHERKGHDFATLAYKQTSGQLFQTNRSDTLPGIVYAAYHAPTQNQRHPLEVGQYVQNISQALLNLYWKNVDAFAYIDEQTPLATFVYDFLLSAGLHSENIFFQAIQELPSLLQKRKDRFFQELTHVFDVSMTDIETLETDFAASDVAKSNINDERIFQFLLKRTGNTSFVGKNYEIYAGFFGIFLLAKGYGWEQVKSIFNMHKLTKSPYLADRLIRSLEQNQIALTLKTLATSDTRYESLEAISIQHLTKTGFQESVQHREGPPNSTADKNATRHQATREDYKRYAHESSKRFMKEKIDVSRTANMLQYMMVDTAPSSLTVAQEIQQQNGVLLRAVSDEYKYFLAFCGDQFAVRNNPKLQQYNIQSITFFPRYGYSGEYLIRVETDLGMADGSLSKEQRTLDLLLTQQGDLTYPQLRGKKLFVPQFICDQFLSVALPRLEYITSGRYRNEGDGVETGQIIENAQKSHEIFSIRPHWVLTPPWCTLKSATALRHQDEVLKYFGISIPHENIRRQESGTLPPGRYVTYNSGFIAGPDVPPNQFRFPEK